MTDTSEEVAGSVERSEEEEASPSAASKLLPQHLKQLLASKISPEVIEARGYESIKSKAELARHGFSSGQLLVPTLYIPLWGVHDGEQPALCHHRPDKPRIRDGKQARYEFPAKSKMVVDVHPFIRQKVRDPSIPLLITEGVKKADAGISAGLCCIALIGTWNFRGSNELDGKTLLPDWECIALKDKNNHPRQVYLCYDSDVMLKKQVYQALVRLSEVLKKRGAKVAYIYLPHGEDGKKVGLDDYLASGHSTEELLALATPLLRPLPKEDEAPALPYRETPGGLVWLCSTKDGTVEKPLTNFLARIVADEIEDDGAETRHTYLIQARRNGRQACLSVPIASFEGLAWPAEHLGVGASCYPGMTIKAHAAFAIRQLSGEPPEQRVYTHTGWRKLESGAYVYLHAGGIIGAEVPEDVSVRLSRTLQQYALPMPPQGEALRAAVEATLRLVELAPDRITVPVVSAVFRSVLGAADFSMHLAGPSGSFKSELAALAQRHFGQEMHAKHLPGSWSSTENALEELAFSVKDALLVIDDFAPAGTQADMQRLHLKADRVLRAQGNNSGRQRMQRDLKIRAERPPRGLILSTGEDVPQGRSLRARSLMIEVGPEDIDPAKLTACQKDAAAGLYAACLAAFVEWLAPRYEETRSQLPAQVEAWRAEIATDSLHRRTPEIAAHLAFGWDCFLRFAEAAGIISAAELDVCWRRGWRALVGAADAQASHQQASEPTQRFLDLLQAAIAGGRAHVAAPQGYEPDRPVAWGWRLKVIGTGEHERNEWQSHGERIGWVESEDLYLQKDVAYNVAKRLGNEGGEGITLTPTVLFKRLHEAGLLVSTDTKYGTLTIRKVMEGKQQKVLHLRADTIVWEKSDNSDKPDRRDEA